ncbi:hypothetical protein LVD15_10265 [Fulvivirga maritima]|uniref:hypothetical protein n=1 Tax=Fulvivirga maritima TaxID=2904247 RepID=UPI001F2DD881|nr:hypothetical protein [Fulvivirga maritima]UII28785.1 hypothetical protein LVD15_10265 [Fulvivirga maritima]
MKRIGSSFLIFGLAAIVLNFLDLMPRRVRWIYAWGETTAWIIMISLVVVGALITFATKKQNQSDLKVQPQGKETEA